LERSEWRFENAQAHCLYSRIERGRVNVVAIVDEEPIRCLSSDDLANLLKGPVRCGMGCDVDVSDPARPLSFAKTLADFGINNIAAVVSTIVLL
jgi:hypothetical protein